MPALPDGLRAELELALLAEFGARAIYADLARGVRDAQLARLLSRMGAEQDELIESLRDVLRTLGLRPARSSSRRRMLAGLLAAARPLLGQRLVLRLCAQAADRAARGFAALQLVLRDAGQAECASTCGRLSETRRRHAQALDTWVQNA